MEEPPPLVEHKLVVVYPCLCQIISMHTHTYIFKSVYVYYMDTAEAM